MWNPFRRAKEEDEVAYDLLYSLVRADEKINRVLYQLNCVTTLLLTLLGLEAEEMYTIEQVMAMADQETDAIAAVGIVIDGLAGEVAALKEKLAAIPNVPTDVMDKIDALGAKVAANKDALAAAAVRNTAADIAADVDYVTVPAHEDVVPVEVEPTVEVVIEPVPEPSAPPPEAVVEVPAFDGPAPLVEPEVTPPVDVVTSEEVPAPIETPTEEVQEVEPVPMVDGEPVLEPFPVVVDPAGEVPPVNEPNLEPFIVPAPEEAASGGPAADEAASGGPAADEAASGGPAADEGASGGPAA